MTCARYAPARRGLARLSRDARRMGMMMMTFICSCRNNNQPTAIYPLGTFPRGLKKAHVMMLPSCPLWYYDDSVTPLVDVVVRPVILGGSGGQGPAEMPGAG